VLSGARGLKRRPLAPHPPPRSNTKRLTDADHFCMIRTAQRRFAPTVFGITRNSDRHQIGIGDRLRRNTHSTNSETTELVMTAPFSMRTGMSTSSVGGGTSSSPPSRRSKVRNASISGCCSAASRRRRSKRCRWSSVMWKLPLYQISTQRVEFGREEFL
jgi:hypothetical protein